MSIPIYNQTLLKDMFKIDKMFLHWKEFKKGKAKKDDICEFILHLYKNISDIHKEINSGIYTHQKYTHFVLNDTKKRDIHKATVKDRFIHYVLFKNLYQYFEKVFIYDSYSCRINKGTQKAVSRFLEFGRKCSKNNTKTIYVLKLDIRKCFASIDQIILKEILKKYIGENDLLNILSRIIESFNYGISDKGIPLGNVTSQLFINVYLHELDTFIKENLKAGYYVSFADDFLILDPDAKVLEVYKYEIQNFLSQNLKLEIKKENRYIRTLGSGVTFLGYKVFPNHTTVKTKNKKRFLSKVSSKNIHSYLGFLKHCYGNKLKEELIKKVANIK